MDLTRRDLGKLALAAIPASRLLAKPEFEFRRCAGRRHHLQLPVHAGRQRRRGALEIHRGFGHQRDRTDGPGGGDLCRLAGCGGRGGGGGGRGAGVPAQGRAADPARGSRRSGTGTGGGGGRAAHSGATGRPTGQSGGTEERGACPSRWTSTRPCAKCTTTPASTSTPSSWSRTRTCPTRNTSTSSTWRTRSARTT